MKIITQQELYEILPFGKTKVSKLIQSKIRLRLMILLNISFVSLHRRTCRDSLISSHCFVHGQRYRKYMIFLILLCQRLIEINGLTKISCMMCLFQRKSFLFTIQPNKLRYILRKKCLFCQMLYMSCMPKTAGGIVMHRLLFWF